MKKLVLTALLTVLSIASIQAQDIKLGAKGGLNISNITGDGTDDSKSKLGFHVGAIVEIQLSDKFSIQPELLYSTQGAKAEYSEDFFGASIKEEIVTKLDYLSIPIMAKFYATENFSLELGPQIGFLLSAKADRESTLSGATNSETIDFKDNTSSIDFGLNLGAGYKLNNGLSFGLRYNLGLSNISDIDTNNQDNEDLEDLKIKNSVFQISVAYFF